MTHKEFSSKGGKAKSAAKTAAARKNILKRWSKPKPTTTRKGKGEK